VSIPTDEDVRAALVRERRTNMRLRQVIAEVEESIAQHRRDLDIQFARIAQLQAEIDRLKKIRQTA